MSFRTILAWGAGIWVAAAIEFALGLGMPGPLFLLAIAAGFSSGPLAGALVGLLAGACGAVLGAPLFLGMLLGVAGGVAATLFTRIFSRRNLFAAVLAAALLSVFLSLLLGLGAGLSFAQVCRYALWRGVLNALWIFPIFGIVLVISSRQTHVPQAWGIGE